MSQIYTWRATDGLYFSYSGSSSDIDDHVYYSSNRAFRMDYPDLGGLLGKDKRTLAISSAILKVYIEVANSATLTMGYSYKTAFADRKALLTQKTGITMKTSTGWMDIDLTDVIRAYVRDGINSTMRLWGYGTGGSSSNSRFRGIDPGSSYSSQRPYLLITFNDSMARIYSDGEWKAAVPYVYHNGAWQPVVIQVYNNSAWR
ncbi:MAG: hypothetical protein ACSW8J_00945 [bacterium]